MPGGWHPLPPPPAAPRPGRATFTASAALASHPDHSQAVGEALQGQADGPAGPPPCCRRHHHHRPPPRQQQAPPAPPLLPKTSSSPVPAAPLPPHGTAQPQPDELDELDMLPVDHPSWVAVAVSAAQVMIMVAVPLLGAAPQAWALTAAYHTGLLESSQQLLGAHSAFLLATSLHVALLCMAAFHAGSGDMQRAVRAFRFIMAGLTGTPPTPPPAPPPAPQGGQEGKGEAGSGQARADLVASASKLMQPPSAAGPWSGMVAPPWQPMPLFITQGGADAGSDPGKLPPAPAAASTAASAFTPLGIFGMQALGPPPPYPPPPPATRPPGARLQGGRSGSPQRLTGLGPLPSSSMVNPWLPPFPGAIPLPPPPGAPLGAPPLPLPNSQAMGHGACGRHAPPPSLALLACRRSGQTWLIGSASQTASARGCAAAALTPPLGTHSWPFHVHSLSMG
ncbi:hypothetical protein V8C86DRAFT_2547785 [Haematococcus lacustris]